MNKIHVNIFKRYLKEKGIYGQYIKNVDKYIYIMQRDRWDNRNSVASLFNLASQWGYVSSAFPWCDSFEGNAFWVKIHLEWQDVCKGKTLISELWTHKT